jgi:alpha-beta hydrolase superfamily lysophospholipase
MRALPLHLPNTPLQRKNWWLRGVAAGVAALLGFATLDAQQRKWIFQAPRSAAAPEPEAPDARDHWIDFDTPGSRSPVRLHARWLAQAQADAPVLLYLHGARCDLHASAERMQHLHELGFAVLGIDYRGFGRSTAGLPSERSACEDAQAAWQWLAQRHPNAQRFVYGHSLGGAIAVQLASAVDDAAGLIVEGTFTSIPEVFDTLKWHWLPLRSLITQRFDSAQRVAEVRVPVLVVHGSADRTVRPHLGRALFERATSAKRFMLVEGGSHHDTHRVGAAQYREALRELFGLVA